MVRKFGKKESGSGGLERHGNRSKYGKSSIMHM